MFVSGAYLGKYLPKPKSIFSKILSEKWKTHLNPAPCGLYLMHFMSAILLLESWHDVDVLWCM
jgi:hypothetical protein